MHRLSNRDKQEFYAGLARLMRAGSPLPSALELMARDTPRGLGDFLRELSLRIKEGEPLGEALLRQRPRITEMEASIVTASSRAGTLDRGCDQLGRYFEALERARREMWSRMAYPLVMLHLTVFILAIQVLLGAGFVPYLGAVLGKLLFLYAIAAAVWLGGKALGGAARHNVVVDALVSKVPGIGPIREKFALARFFATLDAQLEAQVNIWDALANAAKTSDSARIINGAREGIAMLQAGERLSDVLAARKVLPAKYIRSFRVAEQAGELDAELTEMARQSEEMAVAALARWSEWLPRILYGLVLLYAVWEILQWYQGYLSPLKTFDPFNQ